MPSERRYVDPASGEVVEKVPTDRCRGRHPLDHLHRPMAAASTTDKEPSVTPYYADDMATLYHGVGRVPRPTATRGGGAPDPAEPQI